ncbi:MAG: dihydrofolate synthase [Pseudopedobacter saltans]|uniref:Dihydrofolate synthase/folylpolyglutamate synthase n=1 Tax=Pseudopedobacter saltans TaxID=151895 RepID=A0A2W5F8Q3_9SPHI|nr:MAG: dihydrofolate synthase [Pseudopedobacter saltans]
MNYQETLTYLYEQLPMFSRIGASAIKKDLTNTIKLCSFLGNPQEKIRTIHIAGTNGKGSTSHFLSAIFQTAGYKTGLYTSPHIKDFRERIKIDGEMCSQDFVVDFVEKIKPCIADIQPSFFEITVAMAFEYFAQEQVDIAIIETGLGGRLDSTNIVNPDLSIITNIGWDHMDLLGNSLELIAGEKAGIIKENTPVVIGEYLPETLPIFMQKAEDEHSPIFLAQDHWKIISTKATPELLELEVERLDRKTKYTFKLDLTGIYQQENLITVLESCQHLVQLGWKINIETIQKAASNVKRLTHLHGRWDVLDRNPYLIADVGHNKDGMVEIVRSLHNISYNNLYIICGFVKDKDVSTALSILPNAAKYIYTQAHIPRAMPVEELATIGEQCNRKGHLCEDVNEAIAFAKIKASKDDLILVCGSFFVISEIEGYEL